MAELTEFRRLLRKCLAADDGSLFWLFAPTDVPFAWWGDVADIPDGWRVLDEAGGRYVLSSATASGTLTESQATTISNHSSHVVVQPDPHTWAANNTGTPSTTTEVQSGTGTLVASAAHQHSFDPDNVAHAGGTVNAHSAHNVSQDYVPPSISFIWIIKDSA